MSLVSSVFIATSLDGFIARTDGELDWLNSANKTVPEGEDCGYHAFFNSIDVLIMGRKTYEKVLSFGQWAYGSKPVIVLSRHKLEIPEQIAKNVSHSSESPKDLSERLSREGFKRAYIDGGTTIQRFLDSKLIGDLTITLIPVILGSGVSLFGDLPQDISLRHVETRTYDFGFVQLKYQVIKSE
ncbi:dihydrofolate reductase [Xenococcus sp. PCC 7305]|uniref:dihydrofolate reductase family protein n=1 Tax=Xenococcus sp. PCC 7305 TaxID=102125 RepID=UPI0002ABB7EE|nr:dihydrofolate reductase family protein [Xenococcus sp. PCC 7305]ELS02300.1 dihydrofolate reductase [Xenococcus sp. PCC 7305]